MLELNEREKLNERERHTQGEREEEGGGKGRRRSRGEEGREGKTRQRFFGGKKQSLAKGSQKKLTTILLDPYNSTLLSGSTSFWKDTASGSSPSAPPSCLHLPAS